jgi:DNA-binding LytR/AlgR family response regulator
MEKLKCIIVDDDLACLKITEALVKKTPLLDLTHSFNDPFKAADYLSINETNLIFLDIEMPGITGLELIGSLKNNPSVIIISSKKEYAFDAFDLNVVDYLVKPITEYTRFLKAVMKVKENAQKREADILNTDAALFVKIDSVLHNLNLEEILWIEAFGDYVKISLADRMLTVLTTMKSIVAKLPEDSFARVHRSFIVNLKKIKVIDLVTLKVGDKLIPISTFYREALIKKIDIL